jgi:hypothetical protein
MREIIIFDEGIFVLRRKKGIRYFNEKKKSNMLKIARLQGIFLT